MLFYAVALEPNFVGRHDLDIPIVGLPPEFEGYRILHLSDFEAIEPGRRERQVAAIAREARPDLIVVTGDLVRKSLGAAARWRAMERMAGYLSSLPSRDGVRFVPGHGEHGGKLDQDRLEKVMDGAGVATLMDRSEVITRGGASLGLVGIRVHDYGGGGQWAVVAPDALRLGPASRPSFIEVASPGALKWRDVEVEGRLRFSSPDDWVGVTAHARLTARQDRLYMVLRRGTLPFLGVSAHGTAYTEGAILWPRSLEAGPWHRFRVEVRTLPDRVRVRARAWRDADSEPAAWDVEYADAGPDRIESGTVGLYGEGPGLKEFADLKVHPGPARLAWRMPDGEDFLIDLLSELPPGAPAILLSHTPDIFPDAAGLGVPLTLAGHTQGGQIRLPFIGPVFTDTRLGRRFASGLFERSGSRLFVTRGIGTTRIPIRFLSPPEAAVITLKGAPS
ncbi:MAG TPA: hypothetical protein VFP98_07625 [Candidatus Polarisedimenticolia bacterium]|nr:hypothetical protein [Candidatus Polarisedimenticolia bacterium]